MGDVINGQFPKELKLKAETPDEKRIWNYLANNMSEALALKLDNSDKTIKGAMDYCSKEAKKQMEKGAGFAMVEDDTVYGWIIHYFEEDDIKEKKAKPPPPPPKPVPPPPPPKPNPQLDMFAEEGDPF